MFRWGRIALASLVLCWALAPLGARENREIRWKPVKGARGYVVQYRSIPDGDVEELRVDGTRAVLRLPAGRYLLRVAALNKFRKPSIWTPWTPVRLDAVSAVVDLARAQKEDQEVVAEPEPPAAETEEPGSPADEAEAGAVVPGEPDGAGAAGETGFFSRLVPGLPQVARGQPLRGATYWLLFASLAGAGFSEFAAADRIAADLANDPTFLAVVILPNPLELGLYLRQERLAAEREFQGHQANQGRIGAAAALLYLIHLADAFLLEGPGPEPTASQAAGVSLDFDIKAEFPGARSRINLSLRLRF